MRICMVLLTAALLAAWGSIARAVAQSPFCDPSFCANPYGNPYQFQGKRKKAPAAKPAKKPKHEKFLRY